MRSTPQRRWLKAWALATCLVALVAGLQESAPWEVLWNEGLRLQSLHELELAADRDPSLRPELARRLMALHRYDAAYALASSLGTEGRAVTARCAYLLGRYDEALQLLDPVDPLETLLRVDALEITGQSEELPAALDAAEAVLGPGHPSLLCARGRSHSAEGRFDQAAQCFAQALTADPLLLAALFGLGQAQLRLGRGDEGQATLAEHRRLAPLVDALDAALRGVDLAPRHAPSLAQWGDAERALGRTDRAQQAYDQALAAATPQERSLVVLRVARLLEDDRGAGQAAADLLDREAATTPDVRLFVRAGDVLARLGQPGAAAERYRRALALRPNDAQIAARLAALPEDSP